MTIEKQPLHDITKYLRPYIEKIDNHPLYKKIRTVHNLRLFVEQHVFIVWDFMCLLKSLYARLVCQHKLWCPPIDAYSAALIGQIMVEEEADMNVDGSSYCSHFELYLNSMEQIGANTNDIRLLINRVTNDPDYDIDVLLDGINILPGTKHFVNTTLHSLSNSTHHIASTFVFGREAITARMFSPILEQIESSEEMKNSPKQLTNFIHYFSRHITLDNDEHYPKALKMLDHLIYHDENRLNEVKEAAIVALETRQAFLTDIYDYINEKENQY